MRIAVVMGGVSTEHDISLESGRRVLEALRSRGHDVAALCIERDGSFVLDGKSGSPLDVTQQLKDRYCEAVFLALHGRGGEDGHIQAWFEWAGIPYTGSGMAASALTMNKWHFKTVLKDQGLPTPPALKVDVHSWRADRAAVLKAGGDCVGFPAMLKAVDGGSSLGLIQAAHEVEAEEGLEELLGASAVVLWEKRLHGREFTTPVVEGRDGSLRALPTVEIVPHKADFFDLASKYDDGGADEIVPAAIDDSLRGRMEELALACHKLGGCRGMSRTDFILGDEGPSILEINTIPGLTSASLLPRSLQAAGVDPGEFFEDLILSVLDRPLLFGGGRDHAVS